MLDITKKNATVKFTKPFIKGEDGGYYWPEWNDEGQLIWQASEEGMPIIPPFDVKGEDGGYYIPHIDEAGELNWVPSNENMPAVEGANIEGPPGLKGDSGVYVGVEEPTDDSLVWINPEGDGTSLEEIIQETVNLDAYALKTDIPDTSGFTTMSAVEAKGYQTEAQVNSLINTALGVIENGTY